MSEQILTQEEMKKLLDTSQYDETREKLREIYEREGSFNLVAIGNRKTGVLSLIDISGKNPSKPYSSSYVQNTVICGFINQLLNAAYLKAGFYLPIFARVHIPSDINSVEFRYNKLVRFNNVDDFFDSIGHKRKSRAYSKFIINSKFLVGRYYG